MVMVFGHVYRSIGAVIGLTGSAGSEGGLFGFWLWMLHSAYRMECVLFVIQLDVFERWAEVYLRTNTSYLWRIRGNNSDGQVFSCERDLFFDFFQIWPIAHFTSHKIRSFPCTKFSFDHFCCDIFDFHAVENCSSI